MTENSHGLIHSESDNNEMKSIFDCWREALRKFFDTSGRTTRYEFWAFQTVSLFIFLLAAFIGFVFDTYQIVFEIFALYFLAPAVAISIRRLHDIGLAGHWALPMAVFGVFLLLNSELNWTDMTLPIFFSMVYMSYLYWILSADGDKEANIYGARVHEPQIYNTDSRVFMIFMTVFLCVLWLIFLMKIG